MLMPLEPSSLIPPMTSYPPADPVSRVLFSSTPCQGKIVGHVAHKIRKMHLLRDCSKLREGKNPTVLGNRKHHAAAVAGNICSWLSKHHPADGFLVAAAYKRINWRPEEMDVCIRGCTETQIKSSCGRRKSIISADEWEKAPGHC